MWIVLGGEDQGGGVFFRLIGGKGETGGGKVGDKIDGVGLAEVAKLGAGQLVGGRPCGEHGCAGVMGVELADAGLVKADDAGVGEVVFRGNAVRGIDKEAQDECHGGEAGQRVPVRNAAIDGGNGDEQHQRVEGQQVAREQRAAEHAVEHGIDQQQKKDAAQGGGGEGGTGLAVYAV